MFWSLLTQYGKGVMISQNFFHKILKIPTWKNRSLLVKFNGKRVRKFCLGKSIGNFLGTLSSSLRRDHISDMPLFWNISQQQIAYLKYWMFFSFLEVSLMRLGKVIPFSGIKQPNCDMSNISKLNLRNICKILCNK